MQVYVVQLQDMHEAYEWTFWKWQRVTTRCRADCVSLWFLSIFQINTHHAEIHTFIGSANKTHFNPNTGEPDVDPLFPLFHSFIDYIRLLREDCYQFDLVPTDNLEDYIPFAFGPCSAENIQLDFEMTFSVLCDGTNHEGKRLCSSTDITPRFVLQENL